MKKRVLFFLSLLLLSFLAVLPIPEVYAVATYAYDGWSTITITGSTANFAGWYAQDVASGWGTIGRYYANQYYLITTGLTNVVVGDGANITLFWDWAKQVHFANVQWTVKNNATLRFGRILGSESDRKTIVGLELISNSLIDCESGSTLQIYDTTIQGGAIKSVGTNRIWGSHFYGTTLTLKETDCYELLMHNNYFNGGAGEVSGNISNVYHHASQLVVMTSNYNASFENVQTQPTNILSTVSFLTWSGTCNFTNVVSSSWNIDWIGSLDTGVVWRKNTYDLTITFPNGTAINGTETGARVVMQHYGEDAGLDYNATLAGDGTIPTQSLINGFYNRTGNDTIYDYNPFNLYVYNVTGYNDYSQNFTLNTRKDEVIALTPESGFASGFGLGFILMFMVGLVFAVALVGYKKR